MTLPLSSPDNPFDRACLAPAFETWLRQISWSHWVTLTTRDQRSADCLKRSFTDGYIRNVTRAAQKPVGFFLVIEGGALGDHAHIHALISGAERVDLLAMSNKWRSGRAEISAFDPRLGAIHYMLKEIDNQVLDWDFGPRKRPHR